MSAFVRFLSQLERVPGAGTSSQSAAMSPVNRHPILPESLSFGQRVNPSLLPPTPFLADLVDRPVMHLAERHDPLVTHLRTKCTRLGEADMVGMAGCTTADEARKSGDEPQMLPVSNASRLGDPADRLVDSLTRIFSRGHGGVCHTHLVSIV
jgi:hypothetical protein